MACHFNNLSCQYHEPSPCFSLLHSALDRCSCLLCTCRLLGAARKNHSLAGWCPCIFMVSNLSWAFTAAPHSLCFWLVLPPILRVAILELFFTLPRIPSLPLFPYSPGALAEYFYKENRIHWAGSPLLPFTRSANLSSSPLSLSLVPLSHWNSYPFCSQTHLSICAQLLLRDLFLSVTFLSWVSSLFPFSVLLHQHKICSHCSHLH